MPLIEIIIILPLKEIHEGTKTRSTPPAAHITSLIIHIEMFYMLNYTTQPLGITRYVMCNKTKQTSHSEIKSFL